MKFIIAYLLHKNTKKKSPFFKGASSTKQKKYEKKTYNLLDIP